MDAPFCRDCLREFTPPPPSRCPSCGSPRVVSHPELHDLAIAHVDCDAFYAAIEKRDDPTLRDKPVIVGGGSRGVVLTACYNARIFGVRSAMPMFQALRLCPRATIVRPNMAKYADVGRAVRARMQALTPIVQPVSIDEAFLDLRGTTTLHNATPALTLARFAKAVEADIGISVSVGLSDCKFLAKVASDAEKPRGFSVIGRADAAAVLRPKPVGAIWGVGAVTQKRLAALGFHTIGDIQDCTREEFARRIGSSDSDLWRLAHGLDARVVASSRVTKSLSSETTFSQDHATREELAPVLYRLCEKVAARLVTAELAAGGVVLKLKTRDFRLRTRSRTPIAPTQLASRLFETADDLLKAEIDGTRFRLIGIGASDLCAMAEADRGDLLDRTLPRQKATADAIATVRARFGDGALMRGIALGARNARARD